MKLTKRYIRRYEPDTETKKEAHNMLSIEENASKEERAAVKYMNEIYEKIEARDPHETEFLQSTKMLFNSLVPVFVKDNTYKDHNILERIIEPERVISFRIPWIDDEGNVQVNRGDRKSTRLNSSHVAISYAV